MKTRSETIGVFGGDYLGPSIVLRSLMKQNYRPGSVLVHDATGRGASVLGNSMRKVIEKRNVIWVDLADRRRPVSQFAFSYAPHLREVLRKFFSRLSMAAGSPLTGEAIDWLSQFGESLSREGKVTLGAILRTLNCAEIRRWFLDTNQPLRGLSQISSLLEWALRFPAVYCYSEGPNQPAIPDLRKEPTLLWLEQTIAHFEPSEHFIVTAMVDAVVEDLTRRQAEQDRNEAVRDRALTVMRLHLPHNIIEEPQYLCANSPQGTRHVLVCRPEYGRGLGEKEAIWANKADLIWVGRVKRGLDLEQHAKWLSPREAELVNGLREDEVWIRANETRQSRIILAADSNPILPLAHACRAHCYRSRTSTECKQISGQVDQMARPKGASFGLFERLATMDALRLGWLRVRESRSETCGTDGVTLLTFESRQDKEFEALVKELESGTYRARPLRRLEIPKADGTKRPIGIACVRDRVVQAAVLQLIEPIFEPSFSRFSFGYRPGRNARQAVQFTQTKIRQGLNWAVIADIRKCFDSIDHEVLLGFLMRKIGDEEMIGLIRHWLKTDVLEWRELIPTEAGVPQGECLSPLFANIYLDALDQHFESLGICFARYADDFVILTESELAAESALRNLETFLHEVLRLQLKPAKMQFVPVEAGFDFLGFELSAEGVKISAKKVVAMQELAHEYLRRMAIAQEINAAAMLLNELNSVLRGWRNYYTLPGERLIHKQLLEMDEQLDGLAAATVDAGFRASAAWAARERLAPAKKRIGASLWESRPAASAGNGYTDTGLENRNGISGEESDSSRTGEKQNSLLPAIAAGKAAVAMEGSGGPGTEPDHNKGVVLEREGRLFVMAHGCFVSLRNEDLIVRRKKALIATYPLRELSLVSVQGFGIGLAVDLQVKLAQLDIPLIVAPPMGTPAGVMQAVESGRAHLRRAQAMLRDEPRLVQTGIEMITAKVRNQAAVLEYFGKYRRKRQERETLELKASASSLKEMMKQLRKLEPRQAGVRSAIMGIEGQAAAQYWRQMSKLLPEELGFGGRVTFSASDPVNQCLNYVYGILYGEVWLAVTKAGLDPYFGLVHGSQRDQGSLVFDLIEEFRAPFADRVVLAMLGRGFRPVKAKSGLLNGRTRRLLIKGFFQRWHRTVAYQGSQLTGAKLLDHQAKTLAGTFLGRNSYIAYRMKW